MPAKPNRYAATTDVPPGETRAAIETVLDRHGADTVAVVTSSGEARVLFEMHARRIMFRIVLPKRNDRAFTTTETGRARTSPAAVTAAYEQAVRQRWRALYLVIRARLEAIESGIETFEEAFLAHIVLPNGQTVGDASTPAIQAAYDDPNHPMPALLPGTTS